MKRRVVVTGMGAVTSAGAGVAPFWDACLEGRPSLRVATRFDTRAWESPPVGEVSLPLPPGEARASALALLAAGEAIEAAGLRGTALPSGTGVVLGTCLGDPDPAFAWLSGPSQGGTNGTSFPGPGLATPALRLASQLRVAGPVVTISSACTSGAAAIAHASQWIRRGGAGTMLAGGVEALSPFIVSGFHSLNALTRSVVRPFDRRRDGLALGEGAGLVLLEEREQALRRGATILAEISGSGCSGDGHHPTAPSPTGAGVLRAIDGALHEAGREPARLGFISAHGTATPLNDAMEMAALRTLLGEAVDRVPVNSIKPIIGHTLGAAGALEAILCVRAILDGVVPPTINCDEPDPDSVLDLVRGGKRAGPVGSALSISSAFAGHNVALVVAAP